MDCNNREVKPSYYAVLKADVRYDNRLKPNEKLLYAEITALTSKSGECWASNAYFAELYNVSKETVSRWISDLKTYNYINIDYSYNGKEVDKRIIKICDDCVPSQISIGIDKNVNRGIDKNVNGGIDQNVKDNNINNTNNININNNIITKTKDSNNKTKTKEDYKDIKVSNELLEKYIASNSPKVLVKYTELYVNEFLVDENVKNEIISCLTDWIYMLIGNKKFQTLKIYSEKLKSLIEKSKDTNQLLEVIKEATYNNWINFDWVFNKINRQKNNTGFDPVRLDNIVKY